MKNKLLKSLISISAILPISATVGLLSLTSCSKQKSEFTITGTVTDDENNKLSNVNVSCNGKTTKTDSNGNYSIECTKGSALIYFEKTDYIGLAVTDFSFDKPLNVTLIPYYKGIDKTISGVVNNAKGDPMKSCSVTFYPDSLYQRHVVTSAEDGTFSLTIRVPSDSTLTVPYTINNSLCDPQVYGLDISPDKDEYEIKAKPYQYDVKAFVSNETESNNIIMHAYHEVNEDETKDLRVKFVANFLQAFDQANNYTLTFNIGTEQSSPIARLLDETNDWAINFNSTEVTSVDGPGSEGVDPEDIQVELSENKLCLDLIIPNTVYDFTNQGTIGLHLSGSNGKFEPFGHVGNEYVSTGVSNQLCYVRLDQDNNYYQASDNVNPFDDLDWDTTSASSTWKVITAEDSDCLGEVGPKFNFGYKLKIAVKKTGNEGIYILTKYRQPQMSHFLPDIYQPHFFFDTNVYTQGEYPDISEQPSGNDKIKHYSPFSGYSMMEYTVTSPTSACDNPTGYRDFFSSEEARIYSKEDLMITYIPFTSLDIDAGDEFGFACNLQYHYTGGEWFAWEGKNPSGFTGTSTIDAIPHFEDLVTYIRFDSNFDIIPYSQS